jgi:putative phage-type endonuclease
MISNMINELIDFNKNSIKYFLEPKYKNVMFKHLNKKFNNLFNDLNSKNNINMIINKAIEDYLFNHFIPRSFPSNIILNDLTYDKRIIIKDKINHIELKDKLNPPQRTTEWYHKRNNLLSASNIYKALGTQSNKNALILEKCKPIDINKYKTVNINSAMHWGQKYEPVSQMYYEFMFDAIINEYGCIEHDKYNFLGASPDGINVKYDSIRYGRLLEIKSVVSRKLTGIPKKEYWVQCQLQMECLDLDECDFLECSFKEYESYNDFINDGNFNKTNDNKFKGIIICFYDNITEKPYYEYSPFQCNQQEYEKWEKNILEQNSDKTWMKNYYWYLKDVSCVLILRNKKWFNDVLPEFQELWNTILYDRENGYEHRNPKKRPRLIKSDSPKLNSKVNNILFQELLNNKDILDAEIKQFETNENTKIININNFETNETNEINENKIININSNNNIIINNNNNINIIKKSSKKEKEKEKEKNIIDFSNII